MLLLQRLFWGTVTGNAMFAIAEKREKAAQLMLKLLMLKLMLHTWPPRRTEREGKTHADQVELFKYKTFD